MTHSRLLRLILSRLDPRAVPIITRLANLSARPSPKATVAIGALSLLIGLALCCLYLYAISLQSTAQFVTGAYIFWTLTVFMLTALVALVLLPHIIATATAMLVSREVQSDEFALLILTNISGQALFQGYFAAALYRTRVLLALHLGAIPLCALLMVRFPYIVISTTNLWSWDFAYRLAYYLFMGVALWGLNLISIVHAINTSFGGRFTRWAGWLTPVQILIALVIVWLGLSSVFGPVMRVPIEALYPLAIPIPLIVALIVAIMPFAGTRKALRNASRRLPRRPTPN